MNTAIQAIFLFLKEYFGVGRDGSNKNNRERIFDNMGMQLSKIMENRGPYSEYYGKYFDIGVFKDNSMAECTEYAALTQNILSFMGFHSFYIPGSFSSSKNSEAHAFNLVQTTSEKFFLIDSTNPTVLFDERGNILTARTKFAPLSQEQFEDAIGGQGLEHTFDVCNYQRVNGNIRQVDVDTWKYSIKGKLKKIR